MDANDVDRWAPPPAWPDSAEVAEACVGLLADHRLGRLLDAGGGAGLLTGHLLRSRVVDAALVLDPNPDVLAKVPAPVLTRHGRLEDLAGTTGGYDTILLRQVLHYVESPQRALRLLRDRLEPHGALYAGQIVAPDQECAEWLGHAARWLTATRRRVWTTDRLLVTFAQAGLRLHRAVVVTHWQPLDALATDLAGSLSATAQRTMPLVRRHGIVYARLYWVHARLAPDQAHSTMASHESAKRCV